MTNSTTPALVALLAISSLATAACGDIALDIALGEDVEGSGDVITTDFDLDGFTRIDVSGDFEVIVDVVAGAATEVTVEVDDNLVEFLDVGVRGTTLDIGWENGRYDATGRPTATVIVSDLRSVEVSGASEVAIAGIDNERIDLVASGASSIEASGSSGQLDLDASGASDVDARRLEADDVRVEASGASSIDLQASGEVTGSASGASDITVWGDAALDVETSGASNISRN